MSETLPPVPNVDDKRALQAWLEIVRRIVNGG